MNERPDSFKSLRLLHLSLLAGQALFAIISLFVAGTDPFRVEEESFDRGLQVAASIFSLTTLFIGFDIFKKSIYRIRAGNKSGQNRMEQYRKACIIWWAMVEGPGIFSTVCYLLTENLAFFFLGCLHLIVLLFFMPRKENIIVMLNLNSQDITQLEGIG